MHKLRFRQIHLDFHTSPFIPEVGQKFDKKEWQDRLLGAHVDSITCFSCCHHGMSYHPTKIGCQHPGLKGFDLLRAQVDACHEVGINAPIYLTAGVNNYAAEQHPEWKTVIPYQNYGIFEGWVSSPLEPGFKRLCFNTAYLDYLCRLVEEAVTLFPDADGVFFDIIHQPPCCCQTCMDSMKKLGFDPEKMEDRKAHAAQVLMNYYKRVTEAARIHNPEMPVFHNSGNVAVGSRKILPYFSHLELESLPTGSWGYDHYPMSAAYSRNLGLDFLGMTGKFHRTWGEFGGFKHPNALRYECAAMIANNSKCSVGDQLHPSGALDKSTYDIIAPAYKEVEQCEPWCRDAVSGAKTCILAGDDNSESTGVGLVGGGSTKNGNTGAARILLEGHIPFDLVDETMDFDAYNLMLVANENPLSKTLLEKIKAFVRKGGKVVMSGSSVFDQADPAKPYLPIEGEIGPLSEFSPDFMKPAKELHNFVETPFLMTMTARRFKTDSHSLGEIYDPYFNRSYAHFCSHQMTPYHTETSGYSAGVMGKDILYFAHPVFPMYLGSGMVCLKEFILNAIRLFAADRLQVETNLPSTGRVTLMRQPEKKRYIFHLLYANTVLRGSTCNGLKLPNWQRSPQPVEVIEELMPVRDIHCTVRIPEAVASVTLQPSGKSISFTQENGLLKFTVDEFTCHEMAEIKVKD